MRNAATDLNASRAKATTQPRRVRTRFRQKYDAGEIPARVAHGTGANAIAWRVDPSALDASAYLPLFIDGLKETKHPYRLLAVRGGIELTRACGERALLDALPRSVLPMKEALGTGDMAVTAVALELLREFVKVSPSIGEALVPYYRNLLPALNALKDVSDVYVSLVNLTDCRSWREPHRRSRVTDDASDVADDVDRFPLARNRRLRPLQAQHRLSRSRHSSRARASRRRRRSGEHQVPNSHVSELRSLRVSVERASSGRRSRSRLHANARLHTTRPISASSP